MSKTLFRDLQVSQSFDFIDDEHLTFTSFFARCVKTSTRQYVPIEGKLEGVTLQVGSINAQVYHVESTAQSIAI